MVFNTLIPIIRQNMLDRRKHTMFSVVCMLLAILSIEGASPSPPNIHAVIVSSSRYWFNYRHAINALGIYEVLRANGVPDSQIILMIADEYATNARNPFKNGMYANGVTGRTWYSNETEIDYRGLDVTVQNFLDATLGIAPRSINPDEDSNLLIYMTGHGGDQFFKFQDEEEITADDFANLAQKLFDQKKFKQSLWIADTCQAFTLFDKIETPNVLALGTSLRDQSSYAHHSDNDLGLSVIERWTHFFLEEYAKGGDERTLEQVMVSPFSRTILASDIGIRQGTSTRKFKDVLVSEFFGRTKSSSSSITQNVADTDLSKIAPMNPPPRKAVSASAQNNNIKTITRDADETDSHPPPLEPTDPTFFSFVVALIIAVFLCRQLESKL